MKPTEQVVAEARHALAAGSDTAREQAVLSVGNITGLREEGGKFRRANFERGLLLHSLVETLRPQQILELGTGRGLGAFAMGSAALRSGITPRITTLDVLSSSHPQRWPIEIAGQREVRTASRDEVWSAHFGPELRSMVEEKIGPTTAILPELLKSGRKFDLIFIDAGHDLYNVAHDFCYSALLLAEGGWILMDDFAPAAEYGLATCLVSAQARRFFETVEVVPTEGTVYGDTEIPGLPRNMVLVGGRRQAAALRPSRLLFWRFASAVMDACYRAGLFPLGATR